MTKTHQTLEEVLEVLHDQGSRLITLEVLERHATLIDDYLQDGEHYPCVAFQNGVRWFYDRDSRPPGPYGPVKAKAPTGTRGFLGQLEGDHDLVLFEGERDWLTALSIGLERAVCCGGADNVDEHRRQVLALKNQISIIYDNDEKGYAAALRLGARLVELGTKTVKVVTIGTAGDDYSDWAERLQPERVLPVTLDCIREAPKLTKREARRLLKEIKEASQSAAPSTSDEFVTPNGDPVVLIWKPAEPNTPHSETKGGSTVFLRYDTAASKRDGHLVAEEVKKFQGEPDDDEQPDIYRGMDASHLKEKPPAVVPITGDVFDKRVVVLPSGAKEHGSSESVFEDLKSLIADYFVCQDPFYDVAAAYVMMTYRYNDARFEAIPYIRITSPSGSGKTRFCRVMKELCYRSIMVTAMRPVHLYRILSHLKGGVTMVFEEFNLRDSSEDAREFVNMMNAGNQRGAYVPRMSGRNFEEIDFLPLFSPKVITTIDDLTNEGLLRRSLSTSTEGLTVPDSKWYVSLPLEFYQRAAEMRERLLGWRFSKYDYGTPIVPNEWREGVSKGIWQNVYPLIAMVPESMPEAVRRILSVSGHQQEILDFGRQTSGEAELAESIVYIATSDPSLRGKAWMSMVLQDMLDHDPKSRWTRREALKLLKQSGFDVKRGKRMSQGAYVNDWYVNVDESFWGLVKVKQFALDEVAAEKRTSDQHVKEIM